MTPQSVLTELLDRIAASNGAPVLVGADERADWRALLRRLPDSKLFTDDDELINRILREASPAN